MGMRVHGTLILNPDSGNYVMLKIHTEDGVALGHLHLHEMSNEAWTWCQKQHADKRPEDGSDDDGGHFGKDPMDPEKWDADRRTGGIGVDGNKE